VTAGDAFTRHDWRCGAADKHPYELFLDLNEIEHTRTKAKSPQTNGIRDRGPSDGTQ